MPLYAFNAISLQTAPLLLAYGRFEIQFWCMLAYSLGRILAVALGFWIGLTAAVVAVAMVTVLFSLAMLIVPAQTIGYRSRPLLQDMLCPIASSLLAAAAFLLFNDTLATTSFAPGMMRTLLLLVGAGLVYVACMFLIDRANLIADIRFASRIVLRNKPQ